MNNDLEIISLINSNMSNTVTKKNMETTRKSQYNKDQDSSLYSEMMITKRVPVHISNIGDNTIDMLQKVISRDIEGKCIVEGYIKPNTVKNYYIFKWYG